MSIRTRLLLAFVLLSVFCAAVVTFSFTYEMRPRFLEAVEITLIDTSRVLASQLAAQTEMGALHELKTEIVKRAANDFVATKFPVRNGFDANQSLRIYVSDERGHVIFDSLGEFEGQDFSKWRDVALTLKGQYGARATRSQAANAETSTHFVAAPIVVDGKIVGVVTVGKSVDSFKGFFHAINSRIIFVFIVVILAALILGAFVATWISTPIERELEAKQYIERYVHALTHEMKSPLTGLMGASELLNSEELPVSDRKRLLSNIQSEARRLEDLAQKLLELASLEARVPELKTETFDVELLFDEVAESFESQLQTANVKLVTIGSGILTGERFLIWRALSNLVQNALDFSPKYAEIEITFTGDAILVRDRGAGLPDFALKRATEKFFSMERPRTGKKSSGLGLAFVSEVMRLHGGRFELENTQPGARARLSFSPDRPRS